MTNPTQPLPAAPVPSPPAAPKRRRRAWPLVVAAFAVVALIVGYVVADAAAKSYAQDQIKQKVVAALGVDPATDVHVKIGGGSVLLQALSGKLATVDITIPKLAFGQLVGSATMRATEVPLDQSAPLKKLDITYRVSEKNVSLRRRASTQRCAICTATSTLALSRGLYGRAGTMAVP